MCAHHHQLICLPWETYTCCHGAMRFSLTLNIDPYSLWHRTCIKYRKGIWSISFLFLLACAAVTMEINCANRTQPSTLQCQLGLSLIIFHYYSVNCMDVYEVRVFKARSTWVSNWNANKSGKTDTKQRAIFENKIKAQNVLKPTPQSKTWPKTITQTRMTISINKEKKFPFLNYTNKQ
jgi:hypothetical protein